MSRQHLSGSRGPGMTADSGTAAPRPTGPGPPAAIRIVSADGVFPDAPVS